LHAQVRLRAEMASHTGLFLPARRLGSALRARGLRVTTAESCTGGWIAKAITDVAGSSQWFDEGYVTYSNASKRRLLRVKARTLAVHGAVSEETVREMARGALVVSGAKLAVAVSGVAGPDGGTPGRPVGTVWFCWAIRRGRQVRLRTSLKRFRGDRDAVRRKTVLAALRGLQADALTFRAS
jgi:nicotinamide-nucleotide amidase